MCCFAAFERPICGKARQAKSFPVHRCAMGAGMPTPRPRLSLMRKILATLLLLAIPAPGWAQKPAPSASGTARAVFEAASAKVLQIRVVLKATDSQAAIGSGFIVSADGLVVTNYHVISDFALDPDRYRLEFVRGDSARGPLRLLNFDVVHDLALLTMDRRAPQHSLLYPDELRLGERVFSMGNPLDLGLTVVEGTYSGLLERSLYQKIHFTGAINPGMSGGPALTRDGRVFGVNVSVRRDGQLVSFLVPARFVRTLAQAPSLPKAEGRNGYRTVVRDQLMANQESLMQKLLAGPLSLTRLARYSAPDALGPFVRCWGSADTEPSKPFEAAYHSCSTEDSLFVTESLATGYIRYRHSLFSGRSLGPLRFYGLYQGHFQSGSMVPYGSKEEFTRFECHDGFVNHEGKTLRALLCARAYRRLPGLYDMLMRVATLDSSTQGLQSHLTLSGIRHENGLRFARKYLEAITWTK